MLRSACWSAVLLLLLGCGSDVEKGEASSPNILLITIDTQRADRLGCYGFDRPTSPVLDALAARGTRFDVARVPIGRTTQSLASLMTGLYPPLHGVRDLWGPFGVLAPGRTTLAEELSPCGYRTGAAWAVPFFDTQAQGLAQGFDFQRSWKDDVDAKVVSDAALEFLDRGGEQPFFLWLHYRDPHMPYGPPPERAREFGGVDYTGPYEQAFYYYPIEGRTVDLRELPADRKERKARVVYGGGGLSAEDHRRARNLYDAEVAATDAEIGRVLRRLRQLDLDGETLVVVTADHGESLGEHGYYYDHGEFLYDTCLRVPLIFAGPGVVVQEVAAPVRTLDVFPTLLEAAGARSTEVVSGESLWPGLRGERPIRGRPLFAETGQLLLTPQHARRPIEGIAGRAVAVVTDRWKLIRTPGLSQSDGYELYDLQVDPAEENDLAAAPPAECPLADLKRRLADWAARVHEPPKSSDDSPLDPDQIRRLEGVGYIMGRGK